MGYNPLRRYRGAKAVDLTIFAVTLVVLAVLVLWAARG